MKAVLVAIGFIAALALAIGKRYLSRRAKKERLLAKIRELEYEMCTHTVGSAEYNRLNNEWLRLNEEHADICRNE